MVTIVGYAQNISSIIKSVKVSSHGEEVLMKLIIHEKISNLIRIGLMGEFDI